jgi:hypothetical protein
LLPQTLTVGGSPLFDGIVPEYPFLFSDEAAHPKRKNVAMTLSICAVGIFKENLAWYY